jgi:REP-associated tyrosine transposase
VQAALPEFRLFVVPDYRRNHLAGGTFFFTVVTASRCPVLCRDDVREALRAAIAETRATHPFDIVAWVLLPDHLHCVWRLPLGDADYPRRWSLIKSRTTRRVAVSGGSSPWQPRYWEHTVRDEGDLRRHVDYVHWNPVKHGLARTAAEWPYSTFHRYCRLGLYPAAWSGGLGQLELDAGE